jgi:hypothetical protein
LGDGRVLEFESPDVLLSNDESELSLLVKQTGSAEAEHLRMMARLAADRVFTSTHTFSIAEDDQLVKDAEEQDPLIL